MKKISHFLFIIFFVSVSFSQTRQEKLSTAALSLTNDKVVYDPSYVSIDYPNGDVPKEIGVCTDVVIRAFRKIGVDLQKEVHEDMKQHFEIYPKLWGLKKPDTNIDHRRVPNLMTFFSRKGTVKAITKNPKDYVPGDVICWSLGGGIKHTGMVVNNKSKDGKRFLIVHNIGSGQIIQDCLFDYKIIGHYQF
ncbi:DUF1287 domain-containing protein [Polaribacter sp.]|jgi:uncharacterized protein YijF (DUF1287 family)|nr:DUF1287 domain-containing protein [Polaribacter sp.]